MLLRNLSLLTLFAAQVTLAVEGTIPNLTYPTNELFQQISPQLSELHLNQPSVFNGFNFRFCGRQGVIGTMGYTKWPIWNTCHKLR
jgi:hypothetical protein